MNSIKRYCLDHINALPKYAARSVDGEHLAAVKKHKAIRKRRVWVKRLRTVERMLKLRWKILPVKLFVQRYKTAWAVRMYTLMNRRIDATSEFRDNEPLREYVNSALYDALKEFEQAWRVENDDAEVTYQRFKQWSSLAKRLVDRCRGKTLEKSARVYSSKQFLRIKHHADEQYRERAYEMLHDIRKRVKHCLYISDMLGDAEMHKKSAQINWLLWERNDRSEFAEFIYTAGTQWVISPDHGTQLLQECTREADELFTTLQQYVCV